MARNLRKLTSRQLDSLAKQNKAKFPKSLREKIAAEKTNVEANQKFADRTNDRIFDKKVKETKDKKANEKRHMGTFVAIEDARRLKLKRKNKKNKKRKI